MVNIEFFMLRIFFNRTAQTVPPKTPSIAAKRNDFHICESTPPILISPTCIPSRNARPTTRQSTSLSTDSRYRITWLFSPILSCLTIGITTAEEVPPTIAPRKTELIQSRRPRKLASSVAMAALPRKLNSVIKVAEPILRFNSENFRLIPLSKRMIMRVRVVNTLPTCPKKETSTMPVTGPSIIPMIRSNRTLGIFVLLNSSLKRWAQNIRIPRKTTTYAISIPDRLVGYLQNLIL